jgi:large subunit ribosomal protein L31
MAKSTEITYRQDATATCSNCKSVYTLGMTVETLSIEICGNCHPFYTGQETLIDTAGRIEKFHARVAKVDNSAFTGKKTKVKARKFKQNLSDLNSTEEVADASLEN